MVAGKESGAEEEIEAGRRSINSSDADIVKDGKDWFEKDAALANYSLYTYFCRTSQWTT